MLREPAYPAAPHSSYLHWLLLSRSRPNPYHGGAENAPLQDYNAAWMQHNTTRMLPNYTIAALHDYERRYTPPRRHGFSAPSPPPNKLLTLGHRERLLGKRLNDALTWLTPTTDLNANEGQTRATRYHKPIETPAATALSLGPPQHYKFPGK
jgi:hypothetical protein